MEVKVKGKVGVAVSKGMSIRTVKMHNKLYVSVVGRKEQPSDDDLARVKDSFHAAFLCRLTDPDRGKPHQGRLRFNKEVMKKETVEGDAETQSVVMSENVMKERMRRSSYEIYDSPFNSAFFVDEEERESLGAVNEKDGNGDSRLETGTSNEVTTPSGDTNNNEDERCSIVNVDGSEEGSESDSTEIETASSSDDYVDEDVFEQDKSERMALSLSLAIGKYEEDSDEEWEDIVNQDKVNKGDCRNRRSLSRLSNNRPTGKEIDVWIPSEVERKILYCNNSFVVRAEEDKLDPLKTTLWKICDSGNDARDVTLTKFTPHAQNGRVLHFHRPSSLEGFRKFEVPKSILFQVYRPVTVLSLTNSTEVEVVRYLKIPKIFRYMPRLRSNSSEENDAILRDMQCVMRLIAYSVWSKNVTEMFEAEKHCKRGGCRQSWDRIDEMVNSRTLKFKSLFKEYDTKAVDLCRSTKFERLQHENERKKPCETCMTSQKNPIFYKVTGTAQPYDKYFFQDDKRHPSYGIVQEAKVCYSCGQMMKAFSILVHFKWFVYASIRMQIANWVGELDEDEVLDRNEVACLLSENIESSNQTTLEFLVASYAVDKEISRWTSLRKKTECH